MCGIVGIFKFNGSAVTPAELSRLNQSLFHRGPDDEGYFLDGGVGLAMRRLAIIDLSSGKQPMFSAKGNLAIVFNGEVYNYQDLRKELQAFGYSFSTSSDTEVALACYDRWGTDGFTRMNGMWGMAIYDRGKRELILSRDRVGKKQIYYALHRDYLVFGSEMKIPMLYGAENRNLRVSALPEFLTYGYVGDAETAVENIRLLPDASAAVIDCRGEMKVARYWRMEECVASGKSKAGSLDEAAEVSYSLLKDAVRLRLVSDVPVSVMLSSGLDSSACAFILSMELGARLKAFTLGFGDSDFDESSDTEHFARHLGLPWQRYELQASDVIEAFPNFIRHIDSLQANTAQIVYYFVNRMIRQDGVKVTLSGNGGDELYAGYPTYRADTLFRGFRRLPGALRRGSHRLSHLLPVTLGRVAVDYALKKFTECPYSDPRRAHAYWRTIFSQAELDELLSARVRRQTTSFTRIYDAAYARLGGPDAAINEALYADMQAWLMPMLPWIDNISMAHSVEMRCPFLDYRLVEWSLGLPSHLLFSGWKLKKVMKRFLKNRLPDSVLYRKKRGTHLPVSRWLNHELGEIRDFYLSESMLNRFGLFNMSIVKRLVEEHRQYKNDHTFKLWNLIIFSAWMNQNNVGVSQ